MCLPSLTRSFEERLVRLHSRSKLHQENRARGSRNSHWDATLSTVTRFLIQWNSPAGICLYQVSDIYASSPQHGQDFSILALIESHLVWRLHYRDRCKTQLRNILLSHTCCSLKRQSSSCIPLPNYQDKNAYSCSPALPINLSIPTSLVFQTCQSQSRIQPLTSDQAQKQCSLQSNH